MCKKNSLGKAIYTKVILLLQHNIYCLLVIKLRQFTSQLQTSNTGYQVLHHHSAGR